MFVEALEIGLAATENRKRIATVWKRLRNWIRRGTLQIGVVGPGGVGKTTLGHVLGGMVDPFASPTEYHESIVLEEFSVPGETPAVLVVAPGQERRRVRTWPGLMKRLTQAPSAGVINVVCDGHHSGAPEICWKEHPLFEKGQRHSQFVRKYLQYHRDLELRQAKELAEHLIHAPGHPWLVTLVTKQDLWWNERRAVQDHYQAGEYAQIFDAVRQKRGTEHFVHEFASAALVLQNLAFRPTEVLVPTASGYDQEIRAANLQRLFQTIDAICRMQAR